MNEQQVAEMLGTDKPCPDIAKVVGKTVSESVDYVLETSEPTIIPTTSGNLVLLTEQAYKYFLSKCTEDEMWDLGFLGNSEKHARPVGVPKTLKELIERDKSRNITKELEESLYQTK